jgi:oligopeptide transport system substrate-binding protein
MRSNPKLLTLVITVLAVSTACVFSGSATPSSSQPAPTSQPANTFESAGNGIRINYPSGWQQAQPESDSSALAVFKSPDGTIEASLYAMPLVDSDLQTTASSLYSQETSGLNDLTLVVSQAITLADQAPGWWMVATAQLSDGTAIEFNMTVTNSGSHTYLLLTYGSASSYTYYASDIHNLAYSLHSEAPVIAGLLSGQTLYLSGSEDSNPREYDPATTHGTGDKRIFSGLVSFNPQMQLVPELAQSWDVSAGGTVYTFHLRPNARFQNGRAVTAEDIVYSWERAAAPATGSDTVLTYLGDIVGVAEMHSGKADTISGLKVLDDHTLQVTIDAPKPYFLMKLTYPTAFVVDKANVESGPNWYRTPNGTGPYKLTQWISFQRMVYQANPYYYLGKPAIQNIVVELDAGVPIDLFEAGEIDIASVDPSDVARLNDPTDPLHADARSSVDLCTDYVVFDVTKPPFDDIKVRQAFTEAFDRQKFIDVVMNGVGLPAEGLYPPALPGYNPNLQGLPYDPAQARALLAQSKYGGVQGLPPIVFTSAGYGSDPGADVSAMIQMWQQNLGVTITVENIEPDKYNDLIYSGHHGQLFDGGWCADYPDPENFADVLFHTGAQQNTGNYSNPALDFVLDQARVEQNVNKRIQLYQQAEQIIVQDAPVLFIMHTISYTLVDPKVQGFVMTPVDISIEKYLWLKP